jgi:hypothetical protein
VRPRLPRASPNRISSPASRARPAGSPSSLAYLAASAPQPAGRIGPRGTGRTPLRASAAASPRPRVQPGPGDAALPSPLRIVIDAALPSTPFKLTDLSMGSASASDTPVCAELDGTLELDVLGLRAAAGEDSLPVDLSLAAQADLSFAAQASLLGGVAAHAAGKSSTGPLLSPVTPRSPSGAFAAADSAVKADGASLQNSSAGDDGDEGGLELSDGDTSLGEVTERTVFRRCVTPNSVACERRGVWAHGLMRAVCRASLCSTSASCWTSGRCGDGPVVVDTVMLTNQHDFRYDMT